MQKKFLISDKNNKPQKLTFLEAIKFLESSEETKKKLDKEFFTMLKNNKDYFDEVIYNVETEVAKKR